MSAVAVRADGFCAGPDCRNVRPEAAVKAGDPFCSRQCATDSFATVKETAGAATPAEAAVSSTAAPITLGPSERVTLAHVADGLRTAPEIAAARGCNVTAVSMHLKSLLDKGQVVRVSRGVYALATDSGREPQAEDATAAATVGAARSSDHSRTASTPPARTGRASSRPEDTDDDFPDETKDAYATALIAAARAFADTLEQELALL